MHRIDSSTATPDNKFTEGDPTIPVAATTVTAGWLNAVQEEIVKVVLESGLELDKSDNTQLLQALVKIIGVKAPIATVKAPGLVQVGSGLAITAAGLLSVLVATAARAGIMQPDGTTCAVDANGVLSVIKKADAAVERLEVLRKLTIGAPKFHRSTVLPDDHAWPDGSFVEFEDWPEFYEIYEQGGFTGLVMPWDAETEEQAANLGKFRPNAANPTGLYLPLHGGQFFRNWTLGGDGMAGAWTPDTSRNLTGKIIGCVPNTRFAWFDAEGALYGDQVTSIGNPSSPITTSDSSRLCLDASRVWGASHTAAEFAPPHVWQPVIIYLGRPR